MHHQVEQKDLDMTMDMRLTTIIVVSAHFKYQAVVMGNVGQKCLQEMSIMQLWFTFTPTL